MTASRSQSGTDQKKGSADLCVTGQAQGLPGQQFADQAAAGTTSPASATASSSSRNSGSGKATIPEQSGCGPDVTDYPGLDDSTRN